MEGGGRGGRAVHSPSRRGPDGRGKARGREEGAGPRRRGRVAVTGERRGLGAGVRRPGPRRGRAGERREEAGMREEAGVARTAAPLRARSSRRDPPKGGEEPEAHPAPRSESGPRGRKPGRGRAPRAGLPRRPLSSSGKPGWKTRDSPLPLAPHKAGSCFCSKDIWELRRSAEKSQEHHPGERF